MNPIYQMFNNSYIQQQAEYQHLTQIENVLKCVHKLQDFLDSWYDIKPEYRNEASKAICTVLVDYLNKHPN